MIRHVAIIGGGFTGTLQAINLLRHDGPRATLIERGDPGKGLAYGAAHPSHVLNVRAGNMSALPDDPGHFVRWLESEGVAEAATAFVPRLTYGRYLKAMLAEAQARAGDRLACVQGDARDVVADGEGARVLLTGGASIPADHAILSVGNLPPHHPPGVNADALPAELYFSDPWKPGMAGGLGADDTVLILGTGLTMVDVALKLVDDGFAGRIVALSRRGLTPHRHASEPPNPAPIDERPRLSPASLTAQVRARADLLGWRNAVDELRAWTQDMWALASERERRQFLVHLRAWWDVHRHRLAPQVADRVAGLKESGRLSVHAGKLSGLEVDGAGLVATWRPRGGDGQASVRVARAINCTGPQSDLARTEDVLLAGLAARGTIRPDANHLGIDVDSNARTIAADGRANDWLTALGPMTRGAFWEIVAVPDIRTQTWAVARRLSDAHWVGGEGL